MRRPFRALFMLVGVAACDSRSRPCVPEEVVASEGPTGNVVVVLMDDLGVDKVGAWGVHPQPAHTPRLDALADQGVRFRSAYAQAVCWPARAALLTGRLPSINGVGGAIGDHEYDLPDSEVLIPEALDQGTDGGWASAAVGKWHVNRLVEEEADAPLRQGFDRFDGILANPTQATEADGTPRGFFHWQRDLDGKLEWSDEYLTTAQADAAIEAIRTLPEPFFVYVAFSAAHHPLHIPPADLFTVADPVDALGQSDAMIEALDHEIGRLADALDDHTTLIVTSDNGTAGDFTRPPSDPQRSKGSFYAGGTHVPMLMVGPDVAPGVSEVLVHLTDLFPTVLDLAGITPSDLGLDLHGTSLLPILRGEAPARRCVIVEQFDPNGFRRRRPEHEHLTVIEDGYALVRRDGEGDELYARDPMAPVEGPDLRREGEMDPDARDALHRLRRWARRGG